MAAGWADKLATEQRGGRGLHRRASGSTEGLRFVVHGWYRTAVPKYGVKSMGRDRLNPTIGGVARTAGVNVETIRFYQRKGLLPSPDRSASGIHRYGQSEIERLRFIKSAQQLGFSLEEISELLRLDDGTHCAEARQLAERKLADVRHKLTHLGRLEAALSELVQACRNRKRNVSCPLIASLHEPERPPP